MLTAFIRTGDGRILTSTDERTLADALRDPRAIFWLDMDRPTEDELGILDDVFGFHPLAIEDTIQYQQRPKIESYNHVGDMQRQGYFYLVIHGPDLQTFREQLRTKELDIFVSERYLVTVHEEPMTSIETVMKRFRFDAAAGLDAGIDMLLHNILDHLVDHYSPILDHMNEKLEDLEEQAVEKPTTQLLSKITDAKRELLNLRRIIGPQRDVLAQLTRGDVPFIRQSTRVYLRDVQDHLSRAVELIELYRELVVGARDLYLSTLNTNLNAVMKTLTLVTVVAALLNVITGFFGMNFDHIPGLHSAVAFWSVVAVMVAVLVVSYVVFRRQKWL